MKNTNTANRAPNRKFVSSKRRQNKQTKRQQARHRLTWFAMTSGSNSENIALSKLGELT